MTNRSLWPKFKPPALVSSGTAIGIPLILRVTALTRLVSRRACRLPRPTSTTNTNTTAPLTTSPSSATPSSNTAFGPRKFSARPGSTARSGMNPPLPPLSSQLTILSSPSRSPVTPMSTLTLSLPLHLLLTLADDKLILFVKLQMAKP
jgi:hypothetical protein